MKHVDEIFVDGVDGTGMLIRRPLPGAFASHPSPAPSIAEVAASAGLRRVHLLARGHMFNLAGPRPLGHSIESMDLGFALQARCLEAVATGAVGPESCVMPVPRSIDAAVADAFVSL